MEIWRDRRLKLEELAQRVSGNLTEGQRNTLEELIDEVTIVEMNVGAGSRLSLRRVKKLAEGLLIGQHLEELELVEFLLQISPNKRKG